MPDTSSAAYRRDADRPAHAHAVLASELASEPNGTGRPRTSLRASQMAQSGIEPVDGTWFETGDIPPADEPLILLVPVRGL